MKEHGEFVGSKGQDLAYSNLSAVLVIWKVIRVREGAGDQPRKIDRGQTMMFARFWILTN